MSETSGAAGRRRGTEAYREHIERLVQRIGEAEQAIQALSDGEVDAVLDPASAAPILLSRAQAALARSEARFRDLVARDPSIVCEISPEGTILFVNASVRTILGLEPESLLGRVWWELVSEGDRELAAEMRRAMQKQDITGYELSFPDAQGRTRWIAFNSANRYGEAERLETIVLFGVDVTARREAEESERRLIEARIAQADAEAANHAKMEFLAVMSHELRTPLNAITGYVELISMGLRGPVTEAQIDYLTRVRKSTEHLLGLINNVLNFARVDAGHVSFQPEAVPVRGLLDTLVALTEPQAARRSLRYTVAEPCPAASVWADADKVHQILLNLVSNAIKFTPRGGSIELRVEPVGEVVRIAVTDNGAGIPEEKQRSIFDPFVQVDSRLTRRQEGVGLGLAISRGLAVAMGGDLVVRSEPGHGSTFTLTLPAATPVAV